MPKPKPKDSYTFYLPDEYIRKMDSIDSQSRSEIVRESLSEWIDNNINK